MLLARFADGQKVKQTSMTPDDNKLVGVSKRQVFDNPATLKC